MSKCPNGTLRRIEPAKAVARGLLQEQHSVPYIRIPNGPREWAPTRAQGTRSASWLGVSCALTFDVSPGVEFAPKNKSSTTP